MGDDARRPIVTHLGFERRPSGRELVHLAQCREMHVVGDRRAHRVSPNDLTLVVHYLRRRDPVHPQGSIVLRLDLLYCAIESHNQHPANEPRERVR